MSSEKNPPLSALRAVFCATDTFQALYSAEALEVDWKSYVDAIDKRIEDLEHNDFDPAECTVQKTLAEQECDRLVENGLEALQNSMAYIQWSGGKAKLTLEDP